MPYKDYLDQAEEEYSAASHLFNGGFYREAVSRAYYSMFHATQAILIIKKIYLKIIKELFKNLVKSLSKQVLLRRKWVIFYLKPKL